MQHEALFLSVKPRFAERIMDGSKTVELRRVPPKVIAGTTVLIYVSSPVMALLAVASVVELIVRAPQELWPIVRNCAGVTREEFNHYFRDASTAAGIRLSNIRQLPTGVALEEMRVRWPWLRPPQSYRYVRARVGSSALVLEPPYSRL